MDFRFKKLAWLMPSVVALALAGCGGSDSTDTPTTPTTPTENPVVKLPTVTDLPNPDEVYTDDANVPANTLVFSMVDQKTIIEAATKGKAASTRDYANYNLYLWNDPTCDGVDPTTVVKPDWSDKSKKPKTVDKYGPIWEIPLNPAPTTNCINVIVRDGNNEKVSGSNNVKILLSDLQQSMTDGGALYATRALAFEKVPAQSVGISGASAHLIDAKTIIWEGGKSAAYANLYFAENGDIGRSTEDGTTLTADKRLKLTKTTLTDAQLAVLDAKDRKLKNWAAFSLPDGIDIKTLLKGELVAVSSDTDGLLDSATQVQTAIALDAVYADKAKELEYGAIVSDSGVTFRLWAPTAKSVKLIILNADKGQAAVPEDMTYDADSGSWSYVGDTSLKNKFYRYLVEVYHPLTKKIESYEVTDPYSLSLSMNSEYSQVVDLDDADLKPDGWDNLEAPHKQTTKADIAKMVIHESHVRDLTAFDTGLTDATQRGKFVALTDANSLAVQHLKGLAAAGVTHLQILPAFDIATVNEDPAKVANLDDPFKKLCEVNEAVKNSTKFNANCSSDSTIAEVMATLDKDGEARQELNRMVADTDSFNWGYDPFHYTVPEGSYSTNPDGTARILEFRKMVKAIKENIGMNLVMDVVYNHTNESGVSSKSVLDKIVPWYYQRLDETSGTVTNSTCCSNTAPEHAMFAKLMDDSLVTWTKEYKVDAFRFDLMGHHPKAQMVEALAKVKAVDSEMYFYGEGWNFGEVENDARFEQATQKHLGGTGIGSFSDRLRDAVRGGSPFDSKYDATKVTNADGSTTIKKPAGNYIRDNQGFGNGAYVLKNESAYTTDETVARHQADLIMLGMAGNLKDFVLIDQDGAPKAGTEVDYNGQPAGYANDPIEIQNYVSKHDNQTIFDIIAYKAPTDGSADLATRVRMQGLSLATVLLGQGTAFDQQGSELLRSKSFERDSFDSGDWYNKVDYTKVTNNYDVGLPRKDKDGDNYPLISAVKDAVGNPAPTDILQMERFYKELASLRKSSPLFTLGTGAEVMNRVDFRNVGPEQATGLIVMTIDNGSTQATDLDNTTDGLVVIINATPDAQTTGTFNDAAGNPLTLTGFTQVATQVDLGTSSIGNGATFDDATGTFTVPAWSVAVFSKARGSERSIGLPVSKKLDMGTIAPFADIELYANGFKGTAPGDAASKFTFTGKNYSYSLETKVTQAELDAAPAQPTQFTISVPSINDYGLCAPTDVLTAGQPLTLCKLAGSSPISLTMDKAGTYTLVFNAKYKAKPTLTLSFKTNNCKLLADSADAAPLGATKLALRGAHVKDWAWDAKYELTYKGNNTYQVQLDNVDLSGGFKIADSTWAVQFLAVTGSPAPTEATTANIAQNMQADTVYGAYGRLKDLQVPNGNNTASVTKTGSWIYQLKMNDSYDETDASTKGTISMCQM